MGSSARETSFLSTRAVNFFLIILLVLSAAAAFYTGSIFHAPARELREVELTVRYSDLEILAAQAGMTVEEALSFLREQNITSIGVSEYTLWKLRRDPGCYVLSNLELVGELTLNPELTDYRQFLEQKAREVSLSFGDYIVFMPAGLWAEQVWEHLGNLAYVEKADYFRLSRHSAGSMVLYIIQGADYDNLPHLSLGAKPAQLEQVNRAGFFIAPYLSQRTIELPELAEQMLASYSRYPLSAAVFEGGLVPGYPLYMDEMAKALQKRSLPAVVYEYNRFPKGLEKIAPLTGYNLVVMRPGNINDLPAVPINGIRERRVQMLELQLRDLASRYGGEKLQELLSIRLQLLRQKLADEGYRPGRFSPLVPLAIPPVLYLVMAAGILALLLLLLQFFFTVKPPSLLGLWLAGMIITVLLFHGNFLLTQQLFSLLAAVLFPLYCALFLILFPAGNKALETPAPDQSAKDQSVKEQIRGNNQEAALYKKVHGLDFGILRRIYIRLVLVFLFALAGGLLTHGLLTTPPFFHGMELFRGVKAMYLIPLSAAALLAFLVQGLHEIGANYKGNNTSFRESEYNGREDFSNSSKSDLPNSLPKQIPAPAQFPLSSTSFPLQLSSEHKDAFPVFLRRFLKRPLNIGDLLLLGLLLFAAFIYITRTGHVMEITPAENVLRKGLEHFLGIRPRFKEYFLGYPFALLGLYLRCRCPRSRALQRLTHFFLVLATMAPISVANTFAHITAPMGLSFMRSLHGFWLGCLGGFLLILCWEKIIFPLLSPKSKPPHF